MRITEAELAEKLDAVLDCVQRHGEHFEIVRDGIVIAVLQPGGAYKGVTLRQIVERYGNLSMPGDGFADDLEAALRDQEPIGPLPWPDDPE